MLKAVLFSFTCLLLISCGGESTPDENKLDENLLNKTGFEEDTQFQQDIAAYKTVVNIIRETGLAQNFVILPGQVKNVVAYVENNERILEYNPEFMKQLEGDTNWHGISVLAREIGHHLSHHDLKNGEATVEEELEADRYAGFVLQKMGANLNQAIAAMENAVQENGQKNKASLNARIAALTQGWTNSELLSSDTTLIAQVDESNPTPASVAEVKPQTKPDYRYQIFLAIDTSFYYINNKDIVFSESNGKYKNVGEKKESNKPGFDWIFNKGEASYGVDTKGRLWAFSTDGKFHVVGQAVKLK